jgi:hypothetical protein
MSRQAGSIVRGISKPRRISVKTGRQQVAAMYCGRGQRSRYGATRPVAAGTGGGYRRPGRSAFGINELNWQGRQGSNLRQPVLETGTLPAELHPCREPALLPVRAVSSISRSRFAREKRLTRHTTPARIGAAEWPNRAGLLMAGAARVHTRDFRRYPVRSRIRTASAGFRRFCRAPGNQHNDRPGHDIPVPPCSRIHDRPAAPDMRHGRLLPSTSRQP